MALHYVFNTPDDRVIWDVGHQAYPHKILTGRRDRIRHPAPGRRPVRASPAAARANTTRSARPHSSTSISAGLGMAVGARPRSASDNHVIAVIGDGAMSAGMAYEAMNNAGALGAGCSSMLNDNDMSIARDRRAEQASQRAHGDQVGLEHAVRELGIRHIGPIDGHDVDAAGARARGNPRRRGRRARAAAHRHREGPWLCPGRGSADKGHAVAKFDVATGAQAKSHARERRPTPRSSPTP